MTIKEVKERNVLILPKFQPKYQTQSIPEHCSFQS